MGQFISDFVTASNVICYLNASFLLKKNPIKFFLVDHASHRLTFSQQKIGQILLSNYRII